MKRVLLLLVESLDSFKINASQNTVSPGNSWTLTFQGHREQHLAALESDLSSGLLQTNLGMLSVLFQGLVLLIHAEHASSRLSLLWLTTEEKEYANRIDMPQILEDFLKIPQVSIAIGKKT